MCMIALTVKCNGVIKIAFFIILIFSLVHLTSALKALFLFLDCGVTMLECNVILTLFLHIICLLYLFNPNLKYGDIYRIPQISQKIQRYEFVLISPSPSEILISLHP